MVLFESADSVTRARLLTHGGQHGGVASLTSDTSCVHNASAESAVRIALRRISGPSRALGSFALSVEEVCPGCGLQHSDHEEALERHIYRCPLGAVKYFMHRGGLAYVVATWPPHTVVATMSYHCV